MELRPGQELSQYRLVEQIGAGGMGVVWKARDSRLDRLVAIKFLPPHLVNEEQRRRRFLREARTTAAVGHPNIATVHEIGETDDTVYIVMELVEGQTIRQRIGGEPMPTAEVLKVGLEISDGLARAHKAGIVHRDLKPDNIIIGDDGHVRILDFGLAKLVEDRETVTLSRLSTAATMTADMTRDGMVLGTVTYMSPEQARGLPVDARSDVFSFGATLYEMITGRRAFQGETPTDILAAVVQNDPDPIHQFNADAPLELQQIVDRCLRKDREDRFADGEELLRQLEQLQHSTISQPVRSVAPAPAVSQLLYWIVGLLAVAAVAMGVFLVMDRRGAEPTGERPAPLDQVRLTTNARDQPIPEAEISPDGQLLVYSYDGSVYLRVIDSGESRKLPSPSGATYTSGTWFPDSSNLMLTSNVPDGSYSIWTLSIISGALRKLRDHAIGFSVAPDGKHLAFNPHRPGDDPIANGEIWVMEPSGDKARFVAGNEGGARIAWYALWSPDSKRLLYTNAMDDSLTSRDLSGGAPGIVLAPADHVYPGIHALWLSDGRVIFSRSDSAERPRTMNLWEVRVDTKTGAALGSPRRLTDWAGFFAWGLTASRDARRLAFVKNQPFRDVFVVDLARDGSFEGEPRQLTTDLASDQASGWTPDSAEVLFYSDRRPTVDSFAISVDTEQIRVIVPGPDHEHSPIATADSQWLLFGASDVSPFTQGVTNVRIMRTPFTGGPSELVLETIQQSQFECSVRVPVACVLSERRDDRLTVIAFDPVGGRGDVLFEMPIEASEYPTWSLAPAADRIAITSSVTGKAGKIRVVSLDGGADRELTLEGVIPRSLIWTAAGDGFYIFGQGIDAKKLFHVDAHGEVSPLWEVDAGSVGSDVVESPNGEHLALTISSRESAVWMLEDF